MDNDKELLIEDENGNLVPNPEFENNSKED